MTRPRLLDLFCGAGGAGWGYTLAGFEVIGVDICQQPNYPLPMIQADALEFLSWARLDSFDAIHASPPCQRYMTGGRTNRDRPDLIGPIREALKGTRLPWIIENVPESPLRRDVVLCGSMFGLGVRRHRWFEASVPLVGLLNPCHHRRPIVGVYGHPHGEAGAWPGMGPSTLESWSEAMDIDWMTAEELTQAIPPAYTEHIGRLLLADPPIVSRPGMPEHANSGTRPALVDPSAGPSAMAAGPGHLPLVALTAGGAS